MIHAEARDREIRTLRSNLGPIVLSALEDPRTVEVMLNADGAVWQERLGEPMKRIGHLKPEDAERLIRNVAALLKTAITWDHPLLEGELPLDGSRFAAQLPPVVSAPTFSIRKKASQVFTLLDYEKAGILEPGHSARLWDAIANHVNILVVGGTSSGKTTFVNALIHELNRQYPSERVIIIEDTAEVRCSSPNQVLFHTAENVTMTQLLRTALRMRPDRILVGEVRGPEALDYLDAISTGHPGGICTLHANSAKEARQRLISLVSRNPSAPRDIESLINSLKLLVVHIERTPEGRRVTSIQNL